MQTQLFRRYVWLISTIASAGHITREDIDHRWASSSINDSHESCYPRRTFIRHKQDIADMFDIDIEFRKSDNTYFIANRDDMRSNALRQWLMNNFALSNALSDSQSLRDRILLEPIPEGAEHLLTVMAAMRHNRRLLFTYRKFSTETDPEILLAPYCLRVFKQRWYIYGEPSSHPGEKRVYALDRVVHIQESDVPFTLPAGFDADSEFASFYGMFTDRPAERIRIRVNARGRDYLRSLPLHASQMETVVMPDYSEFEWLISPTFDFIQQLFTFGPQLLVLEPLWLRDRMRQDISAMARLYRSGRFPSD